MQELGDCATALRGEGEVIMRAHADGDCMPNDTETALGIGAQTIADSDGAAAGLEDGVSNAEDFACCDDVPLRFGANGDVNSTDAAPATSSARSCSARRNATCVRSSTICLLARGVNTTLATDFSPQLRGACRGASRGTDVWDRVGDGEPLEEELDANN